MKANKITAFILAALMTASSSGLTALAAPEMAQTVGTANESFEEAANVSSEAYVLSSDELDWTANADKTVAVAGMGTEGSYGYYATLSEALAAIRADEAGVDTYTIECKENADVGSMLHCYVQDNLTINGNGAYVSYGGGEYDLAFEHHETPSANLTGDITVTVNNLNGVAAWGERQTNYAVTLVFNDCNDMNRVYLTTANGTGKNNITLTNCTFDGTNHSNNDTSVYSNAAGTITLTNCSFKGVSVPVNLNNKSTGKQTVTVSGCEFKDVAPSASNAGYAAPVRFVVSGIGKTAVTVSDCSFDNVTTANGDILIGDGRSGKTSKFNVTLTVEDTEAEVQLQNPYKETQTVNVTEEESKEINFHEYFAVAEVDGEKFADLQSAVYAAENNDTIKLVSDIHLGKTDLNSQGTYGGIDYYYGCAINGKTLTFDFDGHTLDLKEDAQNYDSTKHACYRLFYIYNGSTVTVTGNGTINSDPTTNVDNYIFVTADNGATKNILNLENGTYYGECVVKNYSHSVNEISVNGGTFGVAEKKKQADQNAVIGLFNTNSTGSRAIKIYGGTVIGNDPRHTDDGNLVADGCVVTRKGNEYTVIPDENIVATVTTESGRVYSYTKFVDAIANANDGDTVKLLADADGDGIIVENNKFNDSGVVIDLGGFTYTFSGRAVGSFGSETQGMQLMRGNKITIKNGKISSTETVLCHNDSRDDHYKLSMLIHNYADSLTLDGVTLDGSNLLHDEKWTPYTISNCNGYVKILNNTVITTNNGYAFDVDDMPGYDGVTVEVSVDSQIEGCVNIGSRGSNYAVLKIGENEYTKENYGDYYKYGDKFVKMETRKLTVTANEETVEAGDMVEITVKLNGEKISYVDYVLNYNKDYFRPVDEENTGKISGEWLPGSGEDATYANGATKTYKFVALAQTEEVTGYFELTDANARTYTEGQLGFKPVTKLGEKAPVTITLKDYEVSLKLDGTVVTEEAMTVDYTNAGHKLEVVAPTAAVKKITFTYKDADDEDVPFDGTLKDQGTYRVTYTVEPKEGYEKVTGTFTLTIGKPEFFVEVNLNSTLDDDMANYAVDKKIVLVYTDMDGFCFTYNGEAMIDVTANGYRYAGDETAQTEFAHVYAFVTDTVEGGTLDAYKANVDCVAETDDNKNFKIEEYNYDINFKNGVEINDIVTVYGVYNAVEEYFDNSIEDYQKYLLKADTNGDKVVDGFDTGAVVSAVRAEKAANN